MATSLDNHQKHIALHLVVPEGGDKELLIQPQQGFYVFFRPMGKSSTDTTISNIDGKSVGELLVNFRHNVLRESTQPGSRHGYVAFKAAGEAEEFIKRINAESIYEPVTLDEWYGFMNAFPCLTNHLNS